MSLILDLQSIRGNILRRKAKLSDEDTRAVQAVDVVLDFLDKHPEYVPLAIEQPKASGETFDQSLQRLAATHLGDPGPSPTLKLVRPGGALRAEGPPGLLVDPVEQPLVGRRRLVEGWRDALRPETAAALEAAKVSSVAGPLLGGRYYVVLYLTKIVRVGLGAMMRDGEDAVKKAVFGTYKSSMVPALERLAQNFRVVGHFALPSYIYLDHVDLTHNVALLTFAAIDPGEGDLKERLGRFGLAGTLYEGAADTLGVHPFVLPGSDADLTQGEVARIQALIDEVVGEAQRRRDATETAHAAELSTALATEPVEAATLPGKTIDTGIPLGNRDLAAQTLRRPPAQVSRDEVAPETQSHPRPGDDGRRSEDNFLAAFE